MDIETALAKASLTRVDKRDPYKLFHKFTRAKLTALTPTSAGRAYWNGLRPARAGRLSTSPSPSSTRRWSASSRRAPSQDWKTYLRWHLVHAARRICPRAFVQADFDFYSQDLRGVAEMRPRWKRCVSYVDRDLGEALGQVFVAKTFTPDTKARALAMTQEIEKAMESELAAARPGWAPATKKQALVKLHGMVNKIGYPDKWRDYSSVRYRARRLSRPT